MARRTILVTGAGGFVGSAVTRELVARLGDGTLASADHVAAMVRPGAPADRLGPLAGKPHWSPVAGDIADAQGLAALLDRLRPAAIVHAALPPAMFAPLAAGDRRRLVEAPVAAMVRALAATGGRLVTTGTCAVVEASPAMAETDRRRPSPEYHDYAVNKIHEETALEALVGAAGIPWAHLRLFYLFGRFEAATRLVPHIVAGVRAGREVPLSSGRQIRDYSDVEDVARAYRLALDAPCPPGGATFHIGSGTGLSVRDVAEAVTAEIGGRELLRFGPRDKPGKVDPPTVADRGKAARLLGWAPAGAPLDRLRAFLRAGLPPGGAGSELTPPPPRP